MKKAMETYEPNSRIPIPHDCVIKDIRQESDWLIIDFEDDISRHDSIRAIRPDARTLTLRFHLIYDGIQGIFRHRRSQRDGAGYMPVKGFRQFRKLMRNSRHSETFLYLYEAYHQVIVELDSTLLMLETDSVEFEWTLKEPADAVEADPVL